MLTACFQCGHKFKHQGDAYLAHFQSNRLDFRNNFVKVSYTLRCGECAASNLWTGYISLDECRYLAETLESFKNPLCDNKHPVEVF